MRRRISVYYRKILVAVSAIGAMVLAGFATVSLTAGEPVKAHYPNDRANHHPKHMTE
jgi:hypothetical protein